MRVKAGKILAVVLSACFLLQSACGTSGENHTSNVGTGAGTENVENEKDTAVSEEETAGTRYQPEWTKDAVIYEVNVRQYTEEGTFAAFAEHLQEIKDMGITVLWFMPIHPISETNRSGTLGSYYSVTDYRAVNPEFGTEEDFAALVEQAHEMGFHVMMDWVANHTGWDCEWITGHPDWYTQDAAGEIISPEGMGWPDVADLNYDSKEMRKEMISCMKYWIEQYDIDGYRCDYATGVPTDFWEAAREELETVKPVYMLAEDNINEGLLEKAFDFNYNWGLYDVLGPVAKDTKTADRIKLYIPDDFPDGAYSLNFLDNHDKNSYESTIMSRYGEDVIPSMFALIYTIPGAPLVYTGDEIGLDHSLEFMERDPVDWDGTGRSYRELLAALGSIRSGNPALYCGNYGGSIEYYETEKKSVLAFSRQKDGNLVKCIFNMSKRETEVNLSDIVDGQETCLLHGQGAEYLDTEGYPVAEDDLTGKVTLQPWEFYILAEGE